MRGLEKITDASGWVFYMPKIDFTDIEKYGLGIWDLADWTFGTPMAIFSLWRHHTEFSIVERIIWRIENILRLVDWYLFLYELDGKWYLKPARIVFSKIRNLVFRIGWKISIG